MLNWLILRRSKPVGAHSVRPSHTHFVGADTIRPKSLALKGNNMYDVVIVILIGIVSALLLAKRIINDRNKSQIKKKRFFYYEEEFFSRIYEIRVVYGILIILILGCAIYVYFRISGKLENIFPDFLDY